MINPSVSAKTVGELVALARKSPAKLNYASPGYGTSLHLAAELFKASEKIDIVHVPYKGGSQSTTDLIAGQVQMYFGNASELIPHASGQLKLYTVSAAAPLPTLPGVPTVASLFPGFIVTSWNGLIAPAGLPGPIAEKLAAAAIAAARDPMIAQRLVALGIDPVGSTAAEFEATFAREQPLYAQAVEAAGLKPQ